MEILVAMIILAIAGTAILHSLVTSARVNAKARENQILNVQAQSIMEGFKAYDLTSLENQFSGTTSMKVISNAGRSYYTSAGTDYVFTLRNISCDGSNLYDAVIEVTPLADFNLSAIAGSSAEISGGTLTYATTGTINEYNDAIFIDKDPSADTKAYAKVMQAVCDKMNELDVYEEGWDDQNFYYFNGDLSALPAGEEAVFIELDISKVEINKQIYVDVVQNTSDPTLYTVVISTAYYYDVNGLDYYVEDGSTLTYTASNVLVSDLSTSETIYDNTGTVSAGASLKNVYLFYYPAYSGLGGKVDSETITVNSNVALSDPIGLYVYKQVNPNLSETTVRVCENNYYSPVLNTTLNGSISDTVFDVHWNLCDNIASTTNAAGFTYNGNTMNSAVSPGYHRCAAEGGTSTTQVMNYAVDIKIYEAAADDADVGTTDVLYRLQGSMIN